MIPLVAIRVLRVAATITYSIAFISTSYRLFYRLRRKRFSWDDGWVFMAFLADIVTLVTQWIFAYMNDHFHLLSEQARFHRRSAFSITMSTSSICGILFARLSLASTLLSMLPEGRIRKASLLTVVLFTLFWASILGWKISFCCDDDGSWKFTPYEFCDGGEVVGVSEIVADTASCLCLILMGAYILWEMKRLQPQSKERQMIIFLFSGSIFTAMAALARSYSILSTQDMLEVFTGHFEAAISLIVCNVVVVTAGIYDMLYRSHDISEPTTDVECLPTEKELHRFDRDSGTGSTLTFTEIDSFEAPPSQANFSHPTRSLSPPHTRPPSPANVGSVSRYSAERQSHRCGAGDPNLRTSMASTSTREYYTDSEPCGSVIIILDSDCSESELS
ncbi:hypothetical protein D9758_013422 [Tetrapyrgos nigripes]|uniref:Rhodopsin domain-containing protein n=1 Tax=Tetrapyrgos nigripes TaxID=182062 RepID=A0A8H5FNE2_9AGAR|nr:hypothetical protein D9758_013422 [Tetrapyrgos nigripes]